MKGLIIMVILLTGCSSSQSAKVYQAVHGHEKYTLEQCDHHQSSAERDFVEFCIAHGKDEPRQEEACLIGHEQNTPMSVGGGYLEVYDCAWHKGKNPRDSSPAEEKKREAEYKKKLAGRECMPPDREHDEFADFNNNMSVNGTPYYCSDDGKWLVNKKVEKEMADAEQHKMELWAALTTRVLTDAEFKEAVSYGSYLNIQPMVSYYAEEKSQELTRAFLVQKMLRDAQAK